MCACVRVCVSVCACVCVCVCVPCLGVVAVDLLKSTSPILTAFGVVGVAESWEVELLYTAYSVIIAYIVMM